MCAERSFSPATEVRGRGTKPKVAAEHGAVGCLIYSDPKDDGYYQGDAYPQGAWRSEGGAQRGSVADMPVFPGDPLTPGVGATPGRRSSCAE
jgi:N-acetylated-alpha-linked acidic dipeptidase